MTSQKIPQLNIDPFDDAFLADPYAHHAALRDAGPVVWLESLGVYAMARFKEVQSTLRDHETFCSGRGVGLADFSKEEPFRPPSLLLEADPPLHDRTRGLMNRIASIPAIRAHAEQWPAEAEDLVLGQIGNGIIDAVVTIAEAFPLRVFPELIGIREDGRENLIPYATSVFNGFGPLNRLTTESQDAAADATAWVAEACKRENLESGGWGMGVHEAADRGDCSPAEAERLVRSFLSAGVDTTVNGIANLIHCLAAHPDQWLKLKTNAKLKRKAIEESIRWGGVVQTFFRTTCRDVQVGDATIPEGAKVLLFLAAANRDPRKWENADSFDVMRNASGHVGFGFGIHQCLGQMVARFEMEAVLDALLAHVDQIRPGGEPVRRLNNTLYALETLPVEFMARGN